MTAPLQAMQVLPTAAPGWDPAWMTLPLLVSAALAFAIATYAVGVHVRQERERWFLAFGVLMVAIGWWQVLHALQLSSTAPAWKLFWLKAVHLPAVVIPAAFLVFALGYTDNDRWVTTRTVALLAVEPAVTLAVVWTNPLEGGLMWASVEGTVAGPGFPVLSRTFGPWYLVNVAYSYLISTLGLFAFVTRYFRSARAYRGQVTAILVAAAVPLVVHGTFILGVVRVNYISLAYAVTGVLISYAVFRYDLLDLVPVARDTVIEGMRDGYLVVDPAGRVVDVNPAARALLRTRSGGDVVGGNRDPGGDGDRDPEGDENRDPGDDADRNVGGDPSGGDRLVGRDAAAVLPEGERLLGRDGPAGERRLEEVAVGEGENRRYLSVDVSTLSEDGRPVGRLVTLRDVTGRRTVEERYRALIEHGSDLITVVAEDGAIAYQSPSLERLLGIDPATVEGQEVFDFAHPADRDGLEAEFHRLLESPEYVARFEFRLMDTAGEWRVFEGLARNLLDEPAVEGVVVNAREVTERKRRERELRRQNERLDEFASVVSHDLRNPLGVAQGYLEILEDDPETYAPEVARSLDRMEAIIDDVLALAREGREVGETRAVDLETVAASAWNNVETPGAELVVEGSLDVAADPDRLKGLFENLFRNCVEHAGEGVTVWVGPLEGYPIDQPGTSRPGFYVADDGPGIDPSEREEVFESGYTTADDGTGFGLSIVERIAEAHGWEVTVAESRDGGARFEVTGVERPSGDATTQADA